MRILLVPYVTDLNRGDQALVWESIDLIKEIYDTPEIILLEGDDERQYSQTRKLGYQTVRNILRHPGRNVETDGHVSYSLQDKILLGIRAVLDLCQTISLLIPVKIVNRVALWGLFEEGKHTYDVYNSCDAIYVKGGGFIHSYGSVVEPYQMYFNLFPMLLGIRLKKDIFMLPNSIGPFKNSLAAKIAVYTLNHCKYVSVRESLSFDFLKNRKDIKVPIYKHFDLGYYLKPSCIDAEKFLHEHGVDIDKQKVVITLRPYRFPGCDKAEVLMERYTDSFAEFTEYLVSKGYQVVFFAHTLGPSAHEDDSIAIKGVTTLLQQKAVKFVSIVDDSLNCQDVMSIYACFDYLIGTRFHSVVFAQNSFVPSIAITYGGFKGDGIMNDLGMSEFAIPMSEINTEELVNRFSLMQSNRDAITTQIGKSREMFADDRMAIIQEIKELS